MYLSFGKKLKGLGRIHLGFRLRWWSILFVGIYVMMYYSVLACIWCVYGCGWLIFQLYRLLFKMIKLPIEQVIKRIKNK